MTSKLEKFINSLDKKTRKKLKDKLISLKKNPRKARNIKKLQGTKRELYRLRLGKIRIIYEIINKNIEIIDIDYRGNIY